MNRKEAQAIDKALIEAGYIGVGDLDVEGIKRLRAKITEAAAHGKEFVLCINSAGGLWQPTMRLLEALEVVGMKGIGLVTGSCDSMAIPLFLACRKRIATPNSCFLFHQMGGTIKYRSGETLRSLLKRARRSRHETLQIQREYTRYCAGRMGVKVEVVEGLIEDGEKNGTELSAQKAKRLGIVHEITTREVVDIRKVISDCLKT